ncbi:MAG: 2-polyprenyl-3-methyl-6-methoxy-1,4-benzoquinone monooxygenase [Pseudomonadota bacterium]|nr:2-polyprenyl-3-methyl-6-methoxy-1,4-benzoquinone monooxygenase [Pseudomonadota bacterium]
MKQRSHTTLDQLIGNFDTAVRTIFGNPLVSERTDPALGLDEPALSEAERKTAAGLMRINHAGEVSAQGLYAGQALTAKLPDVREKMERAALEENDHLAWCENRVTELGERVSILSPLWYIGSFGIGAVAGLAGDKWSLGFVAETEHQVVRHLNSHLQELPPQDSKSRAIVTQMREDEAHHATVALEHGGAPLPVPIKRLMGLTSKVMTTLAQRF